MNKKWKNNILRIEPSDKDLTHIEIDESKIIGNSEMIIRMFGMSDRFDIEAIIYCKMKDRAQETSLNHMKNNVNTINDS